MALILISVNVYADMDTYNCTVKDVTQADSTGKLLHVRKVDTKIIWSAFVDSTFAINKSNGMVVGEFVSNQNYGADKTLVLERSGHDNPYQLQTIYKPNTFILYLAVNDYGDYSSSGKIPFYGVMRSLLISGICK